MSYKILIASALLLTIFNPAMAQANSETRSYMRSFPVGRETTLEVTNKYGTIQVTSWKKDSAYIRAEIRAVAPSKEKLSAMFEGISISITGSDQVLRAQTLFTQNIGRLFESFKGMTSKFIPYDSKVEINYYISIPDYLNLKIDNKYGDVYMEDCKGRFSGSVSNGSFRAGSLSGEAALTLTFCDAKVTSLTRGRIDATFSELSGVKLGDLFINSTSSRYEIGNAGEIRLDSRRDKFFIDTVMSVTGNTYFTDYSGKSLKKEISLTTRYGSLEIESVSKGFESINLNSGYADIILKFEESSSYKLDIRHLNTFITMPTVNARTQEKIINEEKKESVIYGTVGSDPGSASVKIDATRGKIYLK